MSVYSSFTRIELIILLKESNHEILQTQAKETVETDPTQNDIISGLPIMYLQKWSLWNILDLPKLRKHPGPEKEFLKLAKLRIAET